ncbi:5-carboxymethyl-2-oxo-hex-3- ene-1,7-dioate decarboxylase (plasmid) [Cupriavidus necator H850]|uniref:fumarylacetoacetate hydrolase family protein n=1 Tax=Cupriavidus necator TaxID=106590 RepID=UPI00201C4C2E|nr:fumarylacetoacetate hydrolase family protein [Cupriavidus necator]KAI3605393.1 5-carboxymethyl-2-oxo-hex-3- ene-1,7-dioate decarboxylase [Cupriavidus necator H850]
MNLPSLAIGVPPYRLTGTVYGVLANDQALVERLGESVNQPPYKAAPKAPVLYVKPRNTHAMSGAVMAIPDDVEQLELGASLALVIGRVACRLQEQDALKYVAGVTLVGDIKVPHESFYRPSVRFNARDGSCLIGPTVIPLEQLKDLDSLEVAVTVNAERMPVSTRLVRSAARLLADVTDFMTLLPGDVLMLGVPASMPKLKSSDRFAIEAEGIGRLEGAIA